MANMLALVFAVLICSATWTSGMAKEAVTSDLGNKLLHGRRLNDCYGAAGCGGGVAAPVVTQAPLAGAQVGGAGGEFDLESAIPGIVQSQLVGGIPTLPVGVGAGVPVGVGLPVGIGGGIGGPVGIPIGGGIGGPVGIGGGIGGPVGIPVGAGPVGIPVGAGPVGIPVGAGPVGVPVGAGPVGVGGVGAGGPAVINPGNVGPAIPPGVAPPVNINPGNIGARIAIGPGLLPGGQGAEVESAVGAAVAAGGVNPVTAINVETDANALNG